LQLPNLFGGERWGNPGRREGEAHDPFRARGAELLQNLEACLYAYIDAAGIRAETKMPSSALPQAGPVRSSERQEPHQTPGAWSQALRPQGQRNHALDEVERPGI
jgi:hypothetical protein